MSFGFPAKAATWLDPSLKWKTLETPHFSIHFHDGLEEIAKRFAPIAEDVHEELVQVMKHRPDLKTNIVLLDSYDYGNALTTVIPDPRIIIYMTDWSSNLNPSKYDSWLRFVFIHEYTHVLHLDIVSATLIPFRMIFGRVVFPNTLEPRFLIEGIPTYMETKCTQGGRGRDPRWEMMMRMDILENNIKSIDQAAVDTVNWPMGILRYLYGVEFMEYLSETYGEDKMVVLAFTYGDFLYNFGVDAAFYFAYGKDLAMLWEEWLAHDREKYHRQKESLGRLTEPQLLTTSGYYNLKPRWSPDSKRIYYQQSSADSYPNIRVLDLASRQDKKLFEGMVFDNNLSLDPSGRKMLFSKQDIYRNFYFYRDLYFLELRSGKLDRLTEGERIFDADLSPDGSRIVFVNNKLGTRTLMLIKADGSQPRLLCSVEANVQYYSPRWSPDGSRIAVAKWLPGGKQKIYLIDPESGREERLTRGESLTSEANPCFSPAGDYVFFDSDRNGIVNLYAYHLKSNRLFQVTNVIGGAMMPDVSPDGRKIAYISYSSRGYDVAVMDVKHSGWNEVVLKPEVKLAQVAGKREEPRMDIQTGERKEVRLNTESFNSYEERVRKWESYSQVRVPSEEYKIHDYDPLPTLRPKFWLPLEYSNENGYQMYIYTFGSDILGHHDYTAQVGFDWSADRPLFLLRYRNNQFLPQISLTYEDNSVPYDWSGSTLWLRESVATAAFTLYDNRVFYEWDRQALAVGYEQTNISNISSIESLSIKPSMGNVNGFFVLWKYLNARKYTKSISPEDGMNISLKVTMNSSDLGSDYIYTTYSGDLATYFKTPLKHHVLAPTLYGFYSEGDQLEQSNFSWRYLPIRGYPSTNLKGNRGMLLSTEYRFPISYMEKGFMYGYTFFDKIWADFFFDIGGATFDPISNLKLKRSFGLELNLDTLSLWYMGLTLKLGYVKGMDEDGEDKFYFAIGGMI